MIDKYEKHQPEILPQIDSQKSENWDQLLGLPRLVPKVRINSRNHRVTMISQCQTIVYISSFFLAIENFLPLHFHFRCHRPEIFGISGGRKKNCQVYSSTACRLASSLEIKKNRIMMNDLGVLLRLPGQLQWEVEYPAQASQVHRQNLRQEHSKVFVVVVINEDEVTLTSGLDW